MNEDDLDSLGAVGWVTEVLSPAPSAECGRTTSCGIVRLPPEVVGSEQVKDESGRAAKGGGGRGGKEQDRFLKSFLQAEAVD